MPREGPILRGTAPTRKKMAVRPFAYAASVWRQRGSSQHVYAGVSTIEKSPARRFIRFRSTIGPSAGLSTESQSPTSRVQRASTLPGCFMHEILGGVLAHGQFPTFSYRA
jgi:hypothetical protein